MTIIAYWIGDSMSGHAMGQTMAFCTLLSGEAWLIVIGLSLLSIIQVEVFKWVKRLKNR